MASGNSKSVDSFADTDELPILRAVEKPQKPRKNRTIVYIDGFNLYHGAVKGTDVKWLDIQTYFERLRSQDDVVQIHYFTARVSGDSRRRQETLLRAFFTLPKVNVVEGRYKTKRVMCRTTTCSHDGERRFTTWEEKRTDVNIAVQMMDDAYRNLCDIFVVVSGDSDLVPPILRIKERFGSKRIVVYVPARDAARGAATEIRTAAHRDALLPLELLKKCQFPAKLPDGAGGFIEKPAEW